MTDRKRKNKKFVQHKNYGRHLIAWSTGHKANTMFTRAGKRINVTRDVAKDYILNSYPWAVLIVVVCRSEQGDEYMESQLVQATTKTPYHELLDVLNEHHNRLIDEANEPDVINIGWIASPRGEDIGDRLAGDIMQTLGAFNFVRGDRDFRINLEAQQA